MTNIGQQKGSSSRGPRLVAAVCAAVAFGSVVYLATRVPAAIARGDGSVAVVLVFGGLLAFACVDFVRYVVGRPPLGTSKNVWFQWIGINFISAVMMTWETRRGQIGVAVSVAFILLGLVGDALERRARAAEPRVAADRAAPGR